MRVFEYFSLFSLSTTHLLFLLPFIKIRFQINSSHWPCREKQCSVSLKKPFGNGAILCESPRNPLQDAFYCLSAGIWELTSPGSALKSRDHRQRMNSSERDKGACEGLKVHKAFLLCRFPRDRQRHSEVQWCSDTEWASHRPKKTATHEKRNVRLFTRMWRFLTHEMATM